MGHGEKMGPLSFGKKDEQVFGPEVSQQRNYAESTAVEIDGEVRRIVMDGYTKATNLLTENIDKLKTLAEALLDEELVGADVDLTSYSKAKRCRLFKKSRHPQMAFASRNQFSSSAE